MPRRFKELVRFVNLVNTKRIPAEDHLFIRPPSSYQVRDQLTALDLFGRSTITHAVQSGNLQLFEACLTAVRDDVIDAEVRDCETGKSCPRGHSNKRTRKARKSSHLRFLSDSEAGVRTRGSHDVALQVCQIQTLHVTRVSYTRWRKCSIHTQMNVRVRPCDQHLYKEANACRRSFLSEDDN